MAGRTRWGRRGAWRLARWTPPPWIGRVVRSQEFRRDLVVGLVVGTVVGLPTVGITLWNDTQLQSRADERDTQRQAEAEVFENTRFVRDVVASGSELRPFRGLNLVGARLSGFPLGCVDQDGEPVEGSTGLGLTCSDFATADLRDADLTDVNLVGASLMDADLGGADLGNADLRGARLIRADLGHADLGGADLRGARLVRAFLGAANLRGADLGQADLGGADLTGAGLSGANLGGADLAGADLRGADVSRANLDGANLAGARLDGVACSQRTRWPRDLDRSGLDCGRRAAAAGTAVRSGPASRGAPL